MEAMENIKLVLIRQIKNRRKILKMNQEDLAEKSGLSTGYIKNIERGVSWPSPESFEALSKGLSLPIGDLLNETSQENVKKIPMSELFKRGLNIPDVVYEMAADLSDPNDDIWKDVIDALSVAIADKKLKQRG